MNVLKVGDNAPDFSCNNQNGKIINLSDMIGKKLFSFSIQKQIHLDVQLKHVI